MLRNEHVLHNLPGPGRALISVRLRRHLRLLLSPRVDGGMKNEEKTESHVQKAPNANHFILVIWGRHDVILYDFFIFDWCHFVTPKGQFGTLLCFVSLPIRHDFSVHMLESLKCRCFQRGIACDIAMPCRPEKSCRRVEARESNQLVALPMLKCLVEKTDYIRLLFHIFFDACWLLLEVIHFAFQSDEATWRWNHLVGLHTHTKKQRRWSQWNDRLDLYREVKMFIWIESHRMLLTLEISWVLPFHEDVAR